MMYQKVSSFDSGCLDIWLLEDHKLIRVFCVVSCFVVSFFLLSV